MTHPDFDQPPDAPDHDDNRRTACIRRSQDRGADHRLPLDDR